MFTCSTCICQNLGTFLKIHETVQKMNTLHMFTCSTCICKNLGTFLEIHVGAPVFSILGISFE